jgi:membrane-anchored protein YejM (alkaline phosphatase superfamily)
MISTKVTVLSTCVFFKYIQHLPDDGWSWQPKHVVACNKRLIRYIYVVVFGLIIKTLLIYLFILRLT